MWDVILFRCFWWIDFGLFGNKNLLRKQNEKRADCATWLTRNDEGEGERVSGYGRRQMDAEWWTKTW